MNKIYNRIHMWRNRKSLFKNHIAPIILASGIIRVLDLRYLLAALPQATIKGNDAQRSLGNVVKIH